ncbi:PSP1 domain-containing protein [Propionibacteriaceae bacterium G1746]|uniref:PSP1 domain-containing protein n=1 Tax=Aestuariimicrobium sp. G57 TaxID=3418485 RepID=UPI003C290D86
MSETGARQVMAVTFEEHGQLHYLRAHHGEYAVGDWVLYPTSGGAEVARVVWATEPSDDADEFPMCAGRASPGDLDRDARNRTARAEAFAAARRLVKEHGLAMKVVAVDVLDRPEGQSGLPHGNQGTQPQGTLVAIYYTAPDRVDFRALVPDLARTLQARIDLRQIGARDAASVVGGIGSCGRELCCSTFLKRVEPVGMRLARSQRLPNNPLQIAGACGKLMCCLKYEHPLYVDFYQRAPQVGEDVVTDQGPARVIGHNVPSDSVVVRDPEGQVRRCPLESVCPSHQARRQRSADLDHDQEP